jgi:hypothetical protein
MPFAIRNLSVLAYAQGFTLWHYRAAGSAIAHTAAPGFFDSAADMIAAGDMLLVSAADGGRVLFVTRASEAAGIATTPLAG